MAVSRTTSGGLFSGFAATLLTLTGTVMGAVAGGAVGSLSRVISDGQPVAHRFVELADRGVGVMAGAYLGTIVGLVAAIGLLLAASALNAIIGLVLLPFRSN